MNELSLSQELINNFHFLRPWWLLAAIAAPMVGWYLLQRQGRNSHWQQVIDPALLNHLLHGKSSKQQRWPVALLMLGLVIASVSMAGPTWKKLPQPVHKTEDALVILLDLSPSMMAQDLKPSRLVRARLKLMDLLNQRQEGLTALIAYAGEAHVVTPLTDDSDTIINLLPAMSPQIMPLPGSNTEMAVEKGVQLLKDAGINQGDLLLVTDGVTPEAIRTIEKTLPDSVRLSILGVGTNDGAPIPLANGGFAKNKLGNMVLAKLDSHELADLATHTGGRFTPLRPDDKDLQLLASQSPLMKTKTHQVEREFDTWQDQGVWLTLVLIPLLLLSFRRGWIVSVLPLSMPLLAPLVLSSLLFNAPPAEAFSWQDLWQTPDQQASQLLQEGDAKAAAETFENPEWQATANYRAGDYAEAAKQFEQDPSANGRYNLGNALAKSGKLQEAIEAYQQALNQNPDLKDAAANKTLVEELLKQQQQQGQSSQDQNQQGQPSQDQQQQGESSQDSSQNQQAQNQHSESDQQSQQSSQQDKNTDQQADQNNQQAQHDNSESTADQQSPGALEQQSEPLDQQQANKQQSNEEQANEQQSSQPPLSNDQEAEQLADELAAVQAQDELPPMSEEERQAMEQWLRKIPDDPSGLLRNKFEYQYRLRRQAYQEGTWQPPENNALERW